MNVSVRAIGPGAASRLSRRLASSGASLTARSHPQPSPSRARTTNPTLLGSHVRSHITSSRPSEAHSFAFAFDIDGVLMHMSTPIPGAASALRLLQSRGIPFILLTNGGGKPERDRVADLSEKLGVDLSVDNFVQSHTPFRNLVDGPEGLRRKTVLVTGSDADKCRAIAEGYGFENVVIPADILVAQPTIWPFNPLMSEIYARTARPLPKPIFSPSSSPSPHPSPDSHLTLDALFVFNDPRDWALDIQLLTDALLSSRGILGTHSPRSRSSENSSRPDGSPTLYFSNADLQWSTGHHLPRLAQGAFQAALEGVWAKITDGEELRCVRIGKPFGETYRFAERVLGEWRDKMALREGEGVGARRRRGRRLGRVYMVGDNPESDIRGANEFESPEGTEWWSVLVRTGVYREERGEPRHKPRVVVDDVGAAVEWAMKEEGL